MDNSTSPEGTSGFEIRVRDAESSEIDQIITIAIAAWKPIYDLRFEMMGAEFFDAFYLDWRRSKASEIRQSFESADSIVCVAEMSQELAGFVTCHLETKKSVAELGNNAVHPDFQGAGIAGRMYEYVFNLLRGEGIQFVHVHTGEDPAHLPARRAYEKAGFSAGLPSVRYFRKL